MDLQKFYSDEDRLSYNPHGIDLKRKFPRSLLSYDDRFITVSRKLEETINEMHSGKKLKVLDIGVGDGVYEGLIFDRVKDKCDFYGVDLSKEQIKRAGKYLREGKVVDLDTEKLPYKSSKFDIVLVSEVLEHVFFPEKITSEVRRVLKTKGKFILTYPNVGAVQIRSTLFFFGDNPMVNYRNNKEHIRFYRDIDMDQLVDMKKVHYQGLGSFFFDKWNCGFKLPTPRFVEIFFNKFVPTLALGHLSIYEK